MSKIIIIAAMSEKDHVIGLNNSIPWSVPAEMKHFRESTHGSTVIMGRKTFESLDCKPLPGRQNIVLSRLNNKEDQSIVKYTSSASEALTMASKDRIFIIGGHSIYEMFLPLADEMVLSFIKGDYNGDTFFPDFNENDWSIGKIVMNDLFDVKYFEKVRF